MPYQELLTFITQSRQAGQTDEQIKATLRSAGWQEGDIQEGFKFGNKLAVQAPQAASPRPNPAQNYSDVLYGLKRPAEDSGLKTGLGKKIAWLLVIVLILLAGGAGYYFKDNLMDLPEMEKIKDLISKFI